MEIALSVASSIIYIKTPGAAVWQPLVMSEGVPS